MLGQVVSHLARGAAVIGRRSFLAGILGAAAAPAIVRAESLMKIVVPRAGLIMGEIGVIDDGFRFIVTPQLRRTFPMLVAPLIHGSPLATIRFRRYDGGPIFVPSNILDDLLHGDRKTA